MIANREVGFGDAELYPPDNGGVSVQGHDGGGNESVFSGDGIDTLDPMAGEDTVGGMDCIAADRCTCRAC